MRKLVLLLQCLLISLSAYAHEVRSSYLELQETTPSEWNVTWKQPLTNGQRLKIDPVFPPECSESIATLSVSSATLLKRWTIKCDLDEGVIQVTGLSQTLTDTFVRVTDLSDKVRSTVLRGGESSFALSSVSTSTPIFSYIRVGVELSLIHI